MEINSQMPNVLLKITEHTQHLPCPAPQTLAHTLLAVFALLFRVELPELAIKEVSLNIRRSPAAISRMLVEAS